MKNRLFLVVAVAMLMLLTACESDNQAIIGNVDNGMEEVMVLSQRQKDILREEGLPEQYEELSMSQKMSIEAIETMLSYLEESYDDSFSYDGYWIADFGTEEHLTATCSVGTVTVYRSYVDGLAVFSDDYIGVKMTPAYEQALADFFAKTLGDTQMLVVSMLSDAEANENVLAGASASSSVVMEEKSGLPELQSLTEEYVAWIKPQLNGHSATLSIFVVENGALDKLDRDNLSETLLGDVVKTHINCAVSASGTVNIF